MNSIKLAFTTILSTILLTACSATHKVHVDSAPNHDFTVYNTFTWTAANPMIVQSDYVISPFIRDHVMESIKDNMESKGYRYVEQLENADFAIAFTIGARDKVRVNTEPAIIYGNWGWGRQYWGPEIVTINQPVTYTKGTLAIDIFDVKGKKPIWHGVGSKRLNTSEKESDLPGTTGAVNMILQTFPLN